MSSLKNKTYGILFVFCFLCAFTKLAAQNNKAQDNTSIRSNPGGLSYYKTDLANTPVKDIANKYLKGGFKEINKAVLNVGIPRKYYWIHFTISNTTSEKKAIIIDIDNSRLNEMELFTWSGDSIYSLGKLGDFYPFAERYVLNKDFIYKDSVFATQTKQYFLFINQVGNTFLLPIKIYTEKKFSNSSFNDYLYDGVTYGILLFVAVLSLLFFITSRYNLYLYYGLYIITAIVWFLSFFGLGYQYIWGNYPAMNTAMAPVSACLNILLNLQICQILLRLSKNSRLINNVANYTKMILACLAAFPLCINLNNYGYTVNHNYLLVFLFTIVFAMAIVSYSVITYALKGMLAARLYLVAGLLKAGSIINLAFLELGLFPAAVNMEALLQTGIFIEITLLSYALALRYTNMKAGVFSKVIEAHENERTRISKEIHDGISNSLTGINYGIKNFTNNTIDLPVEKTIQLNKVLDELKKVQAEARNISHNTMPDYIKKSSISDIIEKYIAELQTKARNNFGEADFIQINFSANEYINTFSEAVKLNIFRIVQEILTNTLKHSKATNADILLSFTKKDLLIIAEDNGIGLSKTGNGKGEGMGIKNIRTRVELLDGQFMIKSPVYKQTPEQVARGNDLAEYGTMIRIRVPYRNNLLKNAKGYEY